jgi:hypothetical protein
METAISGIRMPVTPMGRASTAKKTIAMGTIPSTIIVLAAASLALWAISQSIIFWTYPYFSIISTSDWGVGKMKAISMKRPVPTPIHSPFLANIPVFSPCVSIKKRLLKHQIKVWILSNLICSQIQPGFNFNHF